MGLDGYVEDSSQRSFWPNGFAMYIYAETLMNRDCDFEAVARDYYAHAYGQGWEQVFDAMAELTEILEYPGVTGEKPLSFDLERVLAVADREADLAKVRQPIRVQTLSRRLLARHAEYVRGFGKFLHLKALGQEEESRKALEEFRIRFGAYEYELERYFEHFQTFRTLRLLAGGMPKLTEDTV